MAAFSNYATMAIQAVLYPIGVVLCWLVVALSPIWQLLLLLLYTLRIPLRFIAALEVCDRVLLSSAGQNESRC